MHRAPHLEGRETAETGEVRTELGVWGEKLHFPVVKNLTQLTCLEDSRGQSREFLSTWSGTVMLDGDQAVL